MTEAEWFACNDPDKLLLALFGSPRWESDFDSFPEIPPTIPGPANVRKLRLFNCACCRSVWNLLPSPYGHRAVELAERIADGVAGGLFGLATWGWLWLWLDATVEAEWRASGYRESSTAEGPLAVLGFINGLLDAPRRLRELGGKAEVRKQVGLLRCVFGNPFDSRFLHPDRHTPLVRTLATVAYENRELPSGLLDPGCLNALADALESAGCYEPEILNHLRLPSLHVRGCWVLDRILKGE